MYKAVNVGPLLPGSTTPEPEGEGERESESERERGRGAAVVEQARELVNEESKRCWREQSFESDK